jgi:hypothetical protein
MRINVLTIALLVNFACGSCITSYLEARVLPSLPRAIVSTAYSFDKHCFFVGTQKNLDDSSLQWALAAAGSGNTEFYAIAPEKVTINKEADQINPLYNKTIPYVAIMNGVPLVSPDSDTAVLYSVYDFSQPEKVRMLASKPLPDALNAPAKSVFGLAGMTKYDDSLFAAAVRPSTGLAFGTAGSAVVFGGLTKDKDNPTLAAGAIMPVVVSSIAFKIGGDLASIDNDTLVPKIPVALCGDETLGTFYTGICATAGGVGTGVRGVVGGFGSQLAPDAAIGADSIIGGIGAGKQVVIHKLAILNASTRPRYLVVWGGIGTPAATQNMVWALPLVSVATGRATQKDLGKLAKKTAVPVDQWGEPPLVAFMGRGFAEAAAVAGDLFSPGDADIYRAQVGGLDLTVLPGPITDLWAEKDAIFVSVADQAGAKERGGVFYSQAIFDATGRINGWTIWQRSAGYLGSVYQLVLDPKYAHMWNVIDDAQGVRNTAIRTEFTQGEADFAKNVSGLLGSHGGVQGILDVPFTSTSCTLTLGQRISPLCCTGYQTVALVQSGADAGNIFEPTKQLVSVKTVTDGAVGVLPDGCDGIVFNGGSLSQLGAIITSTIVSNATYSWLVVAGNYGVAVLTKPNGQGWLLGGLSKNFVGLDADLRWSIMLSNVQVRRVWADQEYLYVLTTNSLIRYVADPALFADGSAVAGTVIARAANLSPATTSFADVAISGPVGLLATNGGLFQVAPGLSAQALADDAGTNWQQVVFGESAGPVTQLYPISSSNKINEFATSDTPTGGTVYVLCAYAGYHQSQVYRLAIASVVEPVILADPVVADGTVQVIPDQFAQDTLSYLFSRANYRNYFATSGAVLLMSRARYYPENQPPFLEVLNPGVRSGIRFSAIDDVPVVKNLSGSKMGPIMTRSATGSWFVGGDVVFVNE